MELSSKIEAILFWKGEPIAIKKLSTIFNCSAEEIKDGLNKLESNLATRGLVLLRKDEEVELGTNKEMSELIQNLTKEELNRDLGKAGLETLSIVIYKSPISRSEIDYIRGVNSSFILRNLMVRGLVERVTNPKDQRAFLYKPTFELLTYLGIAKIEDMPEYAKTIEELKSFEESQAIENPETKIPNEETNQPQA